jgi:hypothetical protein
MSDGHTTPIFVSEAQAAECLKDGMTVRLIYNETERWRVKRVRLSAPRMVKVSHTAWSW